ncbi:GNAT family N-acetyltransferase [Streptomyces sp900116325]|uniref:GNAT family N-acetyltransferase n=1 Tax=Streptomyces sp. 900116325 TaxID=3154295 RepID=UPI0033B18D1A
MIELLPHRPPALSRWFPAGAPGPAALAEHVLTTGIGRFWADRAVQPRAIAVDCAAHVLLRGDPGALVPAELAPLGSRYIEAPTRFLPVLGASFDRIMPWERMVYIQQEEPTSLARTPRGVAVRRITAAEALAALGPGAAWIHASWGGPAGLAASGHSWGAFHHGEALAVACTYFLGSAYEDLAVLTAPDHRRRQLALSCVTALCADVTARGHTPSWGLLAPQQGQPAARLERRLPPGTGVHPPRHRRTGRPRDIGDENPRMKPHPALRQLEAQIDRETARTVVWVSGPE